MDTKIARLALNIAKKDMLTELGMLVRRCFNAPYSLTLSLTDRCNAKCITCDRWKYKDDSQECSIDTWKTLIFQLRKLTKQCQIAFTGGEPFVKSGFSDLLKYAHELNIYNKIITNGLIFEESNYEALLGSGIDFILFSLNSTEPTIHNYYKGVEGLYQMIIAAIKYIKKKNKKIRIGVLLIITKDNYAQLDYFVNWACSLGVDSIDFQPIRDNFSPSFKKDFPLSASVLNPLWKIPNLKELDTQIDLLIEKRKMGFPIEPPIDELNTIKIYFRDPLKISRKHQCSIGFRNLIILPNADVQLCQYFPVIGNAKKQDIREIWFSKEAHKQRMDMLQCEKPCLAACVRQRNLYDKVLSFLIRLGYRKKYSMRKMFSVNYYGGKIRI